MRPLGSAWTALKLLLSAIFVVAIAFALFDAARRGRFFDPALFGSTAVCAVVVSAMWLQTRVAQIVAGLLIPGGVFYVATQVFFGEAPLPYNCAQYQRRLACEMFNGVFYLGGSAAVALVLLILAALIWLGVFVLVHKVSRFNKPRIASPNADPAKARGTDF